MTFIPSRQGRKLSAPDRIIEIAIAIGSHKLLSSDRVSFVEESLVEHRLAQPSVPIVVNVDLSETSKGDRIAIGNPEICDRDRMLGEENWGRTKHRRIPESECDCQGRVPKRSLPRKTL